MVSGTNGRRCVHRPRFSGKVTVNVEVSQGRVTQAVLAEDEPAAFVGDDLAVSQAAVSTALATVLRGKFCDAILSNRTARSFERDEVLYDIGDGDRAFFFLQAGFVKVGAVTAEGRELIYDVRGSKDVVGELCLSEVRRPDRAVALDRTEAVRVPRDEVMEILRRRPELFSRLLDVLGRALVEAYEQVNTLATDQTLGRVAKTLLRLATKIGKRSGEAVEIQAYLTQEDLSQMVAARRERVSTALNFLRRKGAIHYLPYGHLSLDVEVLERHAS
jgi:CRP/FNR family transcriptional regulator, cyclic AMP receptor protein